MAKFRDVVGFAHNVENPPGSGVWVDEITERTYSGDIVRDTRQFTQGDQVNGAITVNNSISIVGNGYARENIFAMRYVRWAGSLWVVSDVDVQPPRLILRLGGVYNGPTAPVAE